METKEAADKEYKRLHEEKEHMKITFFEKLRDRESQLHYTVEPLYNGHHWDQ